VLLEVDGKEIKIPRKVRGILVLNMPSYASGTQPWGNKREAQVPSHIFTRTTAHAPPHTHTHGYLFLC
jgi:hypothetical protein